MTLPTPPENRTKMKIDNDSARTVNGSPRRKGVGVLKRTGSPKDVRGGGTESERVMVQAGGFDEKTEVDDDFESRPIIIDGGGAGNQSILEQGINTLSPHMESSFSPAKWLSFAEGYEAVRKAFGSLFAKDGFNSTRDITKDEFVSVLQRLGESENYDWTDEDINILFDELDTSCETHPRRGYKTVDELTRGFRPYFDQACNEHDIGQMIHTMLKCVHNNKERKDKLAQILINSNYYWQCFVSALPLAEMTLDIVVCYALFLHGEYTLGCMSLVFQALSGRLGFFVDFGQKHDPLIKLNTACDYIVIYIPFATFLAHKLAKVPINLVDMLIGDLLTLAIYYIFYFQAIFTHWYASTLIVRCLDKETGECQLSIPNPTARPIRMRERLLPGSGTGRESKEPDEITIIGADAIVRYSTDYDDAADVCRAGFVIQVVQGIAHPAPQIIIQLLAGLQSGLLEHNTWGLWFIISISVSSLNLLRAFYLLCTDYTNVTGALRNLVELPDGVAQQLPEDSLVEG